MNIDKMSQSMEKYVMPIAEKFGNERHLQAIRDAFMSLLPITFTGGIAAVLNSAPSVETAGSSLTMAWARFAADNSAIFSWVNALTLGTTFPKLIYGILSPSLSAMDNLGFTMIITLLVHVFWFFGIHDAALSGVLGPIRDGNLSLNAVAHAAGESLPTIFTTPFWVYFVVIGGCGSVLALTILLSMSKSKQLKAIGRLGAVPAFFGISEPVIFGLPLMLNPVFFVPFMTTSVLNGAIAFLAMSLGIVGKTYAMLSWQMPSIIGAFFSTMDWKAPVLIVLLVIMDGLIYFPFFKMYEKTMVKMENGEETEN